MPVVALILAAMLMLAPLVARAQDRGHADPAGPQPSRPALPAEAVGRLMPDHGIGPRMGAGGDEVATSPPPPEIALGLRIYQALPQSVRDAIGRSGLSHLDFAEDLITGYGDIDRIDAEALRAYVGFQRAGLRGGAADLLISADLDGDGRATTPEKVRAMRMLSSGLRSRLARAHGTADSDDDGTVSASEMADYPTAHAMQRFGLADEERIVGLMAFDLNADGWVELDELRQGLSALEDSGAAESGAIKLMIGG